MIVLHFSKKSLRFTSAVFLFALILTLIFTAEPLLKRVSAINQKPIYAVETNEKKVALSFDASWGAEHTEEILNILAENKVHTTFFLVNLWIEKYPEEVKAIAAKGHEIGLHSATHPYFTKLSDSEILREIEDNSKAVEALTGKKSNIFRPPYGDYDSRVISAINGMGLTPIQWSIDSLDWQGLSATEINRRILADLHCGAIILMHNNGEHTAEALKTLIPAIIAEGYQIVPVGKLLYQEDYFIDGNGIMHSGSH